MLNLVVIHRRRGEQTFYFFSLKASRNSVNPNVIRATPWAGLLCFEGPIHNPVGTGFPRSQTCRKNRNPLSGSRKSYFYM